MRVYLIALIALAATAPRARAFEVKHSDSGTPLRWGDVPLQVELILDDDGPIDVDVESAIAAIQVAFETWEQLLPEPMELDIQSVSEALAEPSPSDERNIVRWVDEGWEENYEPEALAVTLTTYDPDTGRITDADVMINAARYKWITEEATLDDCNAAYDLQNVITHEIGHLLGLAHDTDYPEATMYPTSAFCETKKRDLESDDIAGINYLYLELGPVPMEEGGSFGCSIGQGRPRYSVIVMIAFLLSLAAGRRLRHD